ncbi:MAG: hypothetical protein Q9191_001693, partial [Dirinaria sp. TL-2023a]
MGASTQPRTFGERGQANFEVPLPTRVVSGLITDTVYGFNPADGLCAFTIDIRQGALGDTTTFLAIAQATGQLLDFCALQKIAAGVPARGGAIGPIGAHGDLKVTMEHYEPHVTCWDQPVLEDPSDCYVALQSMPASKEVNRFGRDGIASDYRLPKTFTN